MGEKFISAKLDVVFKMLFANEKNRNILEAFLSDMLDIPPEKLNNVVVKNPNIDPEYIDEKYYRLDLLLDIGGKFINVEMQVRYEKYYDSRTLLYWSKQYSSQLDSGENYSKLCPCIAVNIMDYIIFDEHDDFHSKFEIWDVKHNCKLSDKMEIHFFELKKVKGDIDTNDHKKLWLQFLKAETKEEFAMLENIGVPAIENGVQAIYTMSADERVKENIRMREKALHDQTSMLAAEREEGRAEREAEITSKMKALGMSDEEIRKIIGS